MKKLLCLAMLSVLILSGCNKTEVPENTPAEEEGIVKGATDPGKYDVNDFVLYTLDEDSYPSMAVAVLGVDPETIKYTDEKAEEASKGVIISSGNVLHTNAEGHAVNENLVTNFVYQGGRIPLTNSKGIVTTGIMTTDTDKNCSKADEVIRAYVIDTENEEYITNQNDDGSYTIDLYFTDADNNGKIERVVTPKGGKLEDAIIKSGYVMRFYIVNDYVHGISCQLL